MNELSSLQQTILHDDSDLGRVILADGATAEIRVAQKSDAPALRRFVESFDASVQMHRLFGGPDRHESAIAEMCEDSNPSNIVTMLVTRFWEGEPRIIAAGTYRRQCGDTAEVAFAVAAPFRSKGLATLLLERLAAKAARHGYRRFWAVMASENQAMLDVFRHCGFEIHEHAGGGEVDIDLSVLPTERSSAKADERERQATVASMRPFFQPAAVAVIGASRKSSSIGYQILDALQRNQFQGPIYPINPRATEIGGVRAYPSIQDAPKPIELAVIAVPRDAVLGVVSECAEAGVRALVVISAGFAEVDATGRELQQRLVQLVRGYGMRMVGPNCMGLLNTHPSVRLAATFSPVFPPHGRVAMSSQSGALGLAVLSAASRAGIGLSTFVSVGNKADVSGNDLLQYWEQDPDTSVILLYLESFGNPRRFARIARRVSRRKPIVAIKSGRSKAGGRAAGSHTAALAANEVAVDALFHQTGVIRAETLEEMFDLASALGNQELPAGNRVGIITNAGGPGILCADACEAGGLVIPELSAALQSRIREGLPASASTANPVDMIASATPQQFKAATEALLSSEEVDAVIVIFIPVGLSGNEDVIAGISAGIQAARANQGNDKPVYACLMSEAGARNDLKADKEIIPCYPFPESAARALVKTVRYAQWRAEPLGRPVDFDDLDLNGVREVLAGSSQAGPGEWMSAQDVRNVLSAMRMTTPPSGFAATTDEAVETARSIGFPVALKLASRTVVHKTEFGGVHLNLKDADAVRGAFESIRDRLQSAGRAMEMDGVMVQKMLAGGVEVMMGATHDPLFGPLIAFGLGGIHVEILADVCFRIAPLTDRDVEEMVQSIRGYRLLRGYRGHASADLEAIQQTLLRLSRLMEEFPEIEEVDLNPVFAFEPGRGCQIIDARIRLRG